MMGPGGRMGLLFALVLVLEAWSTIVQHRLFRKCHSRTRQP